MKDRKTEITTVAYFSGYGDMDNPIEITIDFPSPVWRSSINAVNIRKDYCKECPLNGSEDCTSAYETGLGIKAFVTTGNSEPLEKDTLNNVVCTPTWREE